MAHGHMVYARLPPRKKKTLLHESTSSLSRVCVLLEIGAVWRPHTIASVRLGGLMSQGFGLLCEIRVQHHCSNLHDTLPFRH